MGAFDIPRIRSDYDAQVRLLIFSFIYLCAKHSSFSVSPSSDNVLGFVERARVESGLTVGPRIFHTGHVIYGAGSGDIHNTAADLTDARSALIRIKAEGGPASFSYKNYNQPSR